MRNRITKESEFFARLLQNAKNEHGESNGEAAAMVTGTQGGIAAAAREMAAAATATAAGATTAGAVASATAATAAAQAGMANGTACREKEKENRESLVRQLGS
jgi:hypothetical protein